MTTKTLRDAGIKTIMLTGDIYRSAIAIGNTLGIDDVRAVLLPQNKLRIVGELQAQGFKVEKVGDGINTVSMMRLRLRRRMLALPWAVAPMWRLKLPTLRRYMAVSAMLLI